MVHSVNLKDKLQKIRKSTTPNAKKNQMQEAFIRKHVQKAALLSGMY